MTLNPGTRLGPYEIVSPLGAGGMGEVYRARDTRLGRDVAVKVLPQHLSANAEVRARFEREAKTVSSLNHPNICTLFDVGREGDTDYLVMELVDGETLATRLAKGALPTADVLRIGAQIADALDRAHRAGVVHRDLKPGNVMLTRSGAKLMDFGLARVTGMAGPGTGSGVTMAALTQSPTMAQPLTAEGTIVGTFQYMAPEQLEGREIDARSDIWAFGCVLYEMATGRHAFEGKSQASLIGAIMHAEPTPISQSAPAAPPELDRLVRAMLKKDPSDRLQSAHDVKVQLEWMSDGAKSSTFATPAVPASAVAAAKPFRLWSTIAIAVIVGAALTALVMKMMAPQTKPSNTASAEIPQRWVMGMADLVNGSTPQPSPDGSYILFTAREKNVVSIHRRDRYSLESVSIPGTEEGSGAFVSPDGAWIGFCTPTALKKLPATGGVAQTIATVSRIESADWGPDNMIYFCPRSGGDDNIALARVPATGGRPETVAHLDSKARESEAWLPEVLPDGKTVLISILGGRVTWHVCAIRPDGSRVEVLDNALLARYSMGYLLYVDMNSSAVLCAPFDPGNLKITGAAVPLTETVDPQECYGIDDRGMLVYVPPADAGIGKEVVWISRDGKAVDAFDTRSTWTQPRIAPDGKRILLRKSLINCELWLYDIARGTLGRITQNADNHDAIWSPDSRSIAFLQASAGGHVVVQSVEGARTLTTVDTGEAQGHPQCWSAAGNRLFYTTQGHGTQTDIWSIVMDGKSKPEPSVNGPFDESVPAISPDGRYIAYVTNEFGSNEVVVRQVPDNGQSWQVSVGGGRSPLWSRGGSELYFVSDSKMMAVGIDTSAGFSAGQPRVLFDGGFDYDRPRYFDVDENGRFVAVRSPGGVGGMRETRVLLNWPAEVKRLEGAAH